MTSSVNVTVCQLCFEDFDTESSWQEVNHRLPVSCASCPNSVCFQCYLSLQRMQKRNIEQFGGIRCPRCSAECGFAGENPVFNRALAALLSELKTIITNAAAQQAPPAPKVPYTKRAMSPERRRAASPTPAALSPKSASMSGAATAADIATDARTPKKSGTALANATSPKHPDNLAVDNRSDTSVSRSTGSRRTEIQIKKKALPTRYVQMNPCGFGSTT
ncbi:hypothetical protein MPSEU_000031200 [Mayamaea pseudoterrestris]|nr:hypothetical protein MPSEU_000031200 [Mayamaea pseudoterrestris]